MSIRSLLVIIAAITGAHLAAAPRVATTVDFLDYAFFDSLGAADHYELSAWEQRIRELADAGISENIKIFQYYYWSTFTSAVDHAGADAIYDESIDVNSVGAAIQQEVDDAIAAGV